MGDTDQKCREYRRLSFLAPLIGVNSILFLCLAGLFVSGVAGDGHGPRFIARDVDPNVQIVKRYIASKMPSSQYHIRAFFPALPLEGHVTDVADLGWQPIKDKGVAQRVAIDFFAAGKAKHLDLVYWIQDGKVTQCMDVDHFRSVDEAGRR